MTPHSEHDSSKLPIEGCPECDREIGRPIQRCFGLGKSSSVIPPSQVNVNSTNEEE